MSTAVAEVVGLSLADGLHQARLSEALRRAATDMRNLKHPASTFRRDLTSILQQEVDHIARHSADAKAPDRSIASAIMALEKIRWAPPDSYPPLALAFTSIAANIFRAERRRLLLELDIPSSDPAYALQTRALFDSRHDKNRVASAPFVVVVGKSGDRAFVVDLHAIWIDESLVKRTIADIGHAAVELPGTNARIVGARWNTSPDVSNLFFDTNKRTRTRGMWIIVLIDVPAAVPCDRRLPGLFNVVGTSFGLPATIAIRAARDGTLLPDVVLGGDFDSNGRARDTDSDLVALKARTATREGYRRILYAYSQHLPGVSGLETVATVQKAVDWYSAVGDANRPIWRRKQTARIAIAAIASVVLLSVLSGTFLDTRPPRVASSRAKEEIKAVALERLALRRDLNIPDNVVDRVAGLVLQCDRIAAKDIALLNLSEKGKQFFTDGCNSFSLPTRWEQRFLSCGFVCLTKGKDQYDDMYNDISRTIDDTSTDNANDDVLDDRASADACAIASGVGVFSAHLFWKDSGLARDEKYISKVENRTGSSRCFNFFAARAFRIYSRECSKLPEVVEDAASAGQDCVEAGLLELQGVGSLTVPSLNYACHDFERSCAVFHSQFGCFVETNICRRDASSGVGPGHDFLSSSSSWPAPAERVPP